MRNPCMLIMESISSQKLDEPPNKELRPESLEKCGIQYREREEEEPSREAIASIASLQAELLDFQHLVSGKPFQSIGICPQRRPELAVQPVGY